MNRLDAHSINTINKIRKNQIRHCSKLVYNKQYFYLAITFILKRFRMAPNQTECSKLEQKSVIKSSVAEKCKPCKIQIRVFDVFRETCFNFFKTQMGSSWLCNNEPELKIYPMERKDIDSPV